MASEFSAVKNISQQSAGDKSRVVQNILVDKSEKDVLHGPVLMPVRDRRVLVMPRQLTSVEGPESSSLYALMREWVQNPMSVVAAVASWNSQVALERVPRMVPGTLFVSCQPDKESSTETIIIPDIENNVENPTLETHLPRWKALGKKRRLEFERKKALGFQRLHKRLHGQIS